jgi:segregation and condensation protein B
MTDEIKEMPNEETAATSEQPAGAEETPVVEEVAETPVQPEAEPAETEETVLDEEQTPVEEALPEDASVNSCEESQTSSAQADEPAATDEPVQQDDTTEQAQSPQAEEPAQTNESEPAAQVEEALVEMIDAAEPQATEQTPAGSEQASGNDAQATSGGEQPTEGAQASDQSPTVESVVEAILFASDEPLSESRLAGIVETTAKQVRDCVESLNARYEANHNAFRIDQIAGGYQMLTQPIYNSWLQKMVRVRSDNKLGPAAMETLAIIAYKQPIIRADIEAIRGVAVGEVIRSLMYKGLVKIAGRAEILGRPMLYGTTKKFLEIFGLNSIKDLPKAEDLKNPDRG